MSRFSFTLAYAALVVVVGMLVLWPGLNGGFIFDDYANLVLDPDWKVVHGSLAEWHRAFGHGIASSSGRPLAMLSFGLNHYASGLDPRAMKLTGVVMHLVNSVLVFLLVSRLIRLISDSQSRLPALLVALAWTLHPLQISTVLYVVQRMEIGACTGVLLALLAYLRARARQQAGKPGWMGFLGASASVILGLGFKESALLAPAYMLAIELCVLRFHARGRVSAPLRATWLLLACGVLAIFFVVVLPRYLTPEAYAFRDFTLGERLLTQLPVLAMYLKQILLPLPRWLLFYYDQFPVSTGLLSPSSTLGSGILLLLLASFALLVKRLWPLTALGVAWFFLGHALTSNVMPLELAFEHRNYFALLGILLALVQPMQWLGSRLTPEARTIIATLPVIALAALSMIESRTWGNPMGLALALETRNPNSSRAAYALAGQLYKQAAGNPHSPAWSMAYKEYAHAASLRGSSILADHALIVMDAQRHIPVPLESWDQMRTKLQRGKAVNADDIQALYGLANCRISGGCRFDDQQMAQTLVTALQHNLYSPTLHTIYANFAWNVMRDPSLAVRMAREAYRLNPADTINAINLCRFLLASDLRTNTRVQIEIAGLMDEITRRNTDGRWDDDIQLLREIAVHAPTPSDDAIPATKGH